MKDQQIAFAVDDDPAMLASLTQFLNARGYSVEGFSTGEDFLQAFGMGRPGCVILDFGLPGMSGLDVQARLIEKKISAQIIFVSGHGGIPEAVAATKAGSLDFLAKPYDTHILLERIEKAFELDRQQRAKDEDLMTIAQAVNSLTVRELEVFHLLIRKPQFASSKAIALELNISPRTAEKHRAQILKKTNTRNVPELIGRYAALQ